jgi:pullulanase/glycogen debranching enzyme
MEAYWTTRFDGVVGLSKDWVVPELPPIELSEPVRLKRLMRMDIRVWARYSGYFCDKGTWVFVFWPELYPDLNWSEDPPCVAGTFNEWNGCNDKWELHPESWDGETVLVLRLDDALGRDLAASPQDVEFKFVTRNGNWLEVPAEVLNRRNNGSGHFNYHFSPERTGLHVYHFVTEEPVSLTGHELLTWTEAGNVHSVGIGRWDFLLKELSTRKLGAQVHGGKTIFSLFAPRATGVDVEFWPADDAGNPTREKLTSLGDGTWEVVYPRSLHGWHYHYFVTGENADETTEFDEKFPILDPYALAAAGRAGPGVIVDEAVIRRPRSQYVPPAPTNLVIVEGHVRDFVAKLPDSGTRPGFRELAAWIRSPDCYLKRLGVNALELQPVQEFDVEEAENYHWGYMPNNWFAPASAYCRDAAGGSQFVDFRDLVDACHEAGLAVILDVVYNHVGEPNHLLHVDKQYYFETSHDGTMSNWSGCGNDIRATAPMARRLIVDSMRHWIEQFDVDGFRLDLAELLGTRVLYEIEQELRPVKPGLILIAEPWSFRGHIAGALRNSSYTSWNDGYRDFFANYVHGSGNADGLRYFLSGSMGSFTNHPGQTLNYTESHDDRCWLDRITENAHNDGTVPTENDARRTRLMGAALFASLGVPMLAAGQDFLRSKGGVSNTYLRGDINALDYARMEQFRATHEYFRSWIGFRLSEAGAALRIDKVAGRGFFRFFQAGHMSALAAWYNADGQLPASPLFVAFNPHPYPVALSVPGVDAGGFRQIADGGQFLPDGLAPNDTYAWQGGILTIPALSAGLWVVRK